MLFVIDKARFQRLISHTGDDRAKQDSREPFFRIEASGESVRLTGRMVEATAVATVYTPGVFFLRVSLFRKLFEMLPHKGFLTIQADEKGVVFGDTTLPSRSLDMLFYPDPATAPVHHPEENDLPGFGPPPPDTDASGNPIDRWASRQYRLF